jgi:hypothetical protein
MPCTSMVPELAVSTLEIRRERGSLAARGSGATGTGPPTAVGWEATPGNPARAAGVTRLLERTEHHERAEAGKLVLYRRSAR